MMLLTGANGFIGKALAENYGRDIRKVYRKFSHSRESDDITFVVDSISPSTSWAGAFRDVDVVVHLAAMAHFLSDESKVSLEDYRNVNTGGTIHLAKEAARNGVRRFIFISTIGVNGDSSLHPISEVDQPNPQSHYAVSKFEAEEGLRKIAKETGMEVVIIRPPMVYGPNAPGNFTRLIGLVHKGLPFPFGSIANKRSLIALENLVDFIRLCRLHPRAANETFVISDGEDISTCALIKLLAKAMNKPCRIFSIPSPLILLMAKFLGRKSDANKLLNSLQIDCTKAKKLLGWLPPMNMEEALVRSVENFLKTN